MEAALTEQEKIKAKKNRLYKSKAKLSAFISEFAAVHLWPGKEFLPLTVDGSKNENNPATEDLLLRIILPLRICY